MLDKSFKGLSDDDLYEQIIKMRNMLGHKLSMNYHSFGDSVQANLAEMEEEWETRQFKETFKFNNDPINLGTIHEDDTEL